MDTGNHHSPNHTVKKKLRICLDQRDLNEALEREPYHTRSVDEITSKLQGYYWDIDKVCMYEEMMTKTDNVESSLLTSIH